MARQGRTVELPILCVSLLLFLFLLHAGAFPALNTGSSYVALSSAPEYDDPLDSESISVEELLVWQDPESGAILASSELYGDPSTESAVIAFGGYELINGSKYSKLSIANCSGNKINIESSQIVLNRSNSQISYIETIQNSNNG
ncbi:MAG: hypothetical protein ACXACI_11355, partial [Candidatus Hodarchaeales archaeon]